MQLLISLSELLTIAKELGTAEEQRQALAIAKEILRDSHS